MEGVLLKRGKQSWKARRFVIENGTLSYTKPSQSSKSGSLDLSTAIVTTFSSGFERRSGYVFILHSMKQSYTLEAHTELDRAQWLAACYLAGAQLDVRESGLTSSYHTEGVLLKKGRTATKMGYFGIKGSSLDYIMRGGEQKSVELRGAVISADVESVDECLFIIKPVSEGVRSYVLKASSELDRGRWLTALVAAAQDQELHGKRQSSTSDNPSASRVVEQGKSPASEMASTTPKFNAQADQSMDYSEAKLSPPREFNFHLAAKFSPPPRNKRIDFGGDGARSSFNEDIKRWEEDEAKIDSRASRLSTGPSIYLIEGVLFQKTNNSEWEEHRFGLSKTTGLWHIDGDVESPVTTIRFAMVHMLPQGAEARVGAVFTIESSDGTNCTLEALNEADRDRWVAALKQAGAVPELPAKIFEHKYFEGVLQKRKKGGLWKERYFVFGSGNLTYSKQKGGEPKSIDTLGTRISPLPPDGGRPGGFAFAIHSLTANRTYTLEADSAAERQNWLRLLIPPPPLLPRTPPGPPLARPPPPSRPPSLVGGLSLPGRPIPPPPISSIAFPRPPPPNPLSPREHNFPALPRRLFTVQEEPATPRPPSRKPPGRGPPRTSLVI